MARSKKVRDVKITRTVRAYASFRDENDITFHTYRVSLNGKVVKTFEEFPGDVLFMEQNVIRFANSLKNPKLFNKLTKSIRKNRKAIDNTNDKLDAPWVKYEKR